MISDASYSWAAAGGEINQSGKYVAGTVAGSYSEAVTVTATRGGLSATASGSAVIVPGPLARVAFVADTPDDLELAILPDLADIDRLVQMVIALVHHHHAAGRVVVEAVEGGAHFVDGESTAFSTAFFHR